MENHEVQTPSTHNTDDPGEVVIQMPENRGVLLMPPRYCYEV
jgi:hypothetical protein